VTANLAISSVSEASVVDVTWPAIQHPPMKDMEPDGVGIWQRVIFLLIVSCGPEMVHDVFLPHPFARLSSGWRRWRRRLPAASGRG